MTTPADWYPDPENAGQLRYWDGSSWTEHRAPTAAPSEAPAAEPDGQPDPFPASEQATSVVSLPEDPAPSAEPELPAGGGSHRAPDGQASPSHDPAPTPQYGSPPTGSSGGGPNKKLIIGILSSAAALILILAVVLVYVFVIRDDNTTVTASSSSSSTSSSKTKTISSKTSTTESETTTTASPTRDSASPVTDGNLTFTITDIEAAESVTSTLSDQVGKTAQGTYAVVHLTVATSATTR